MSRARSASGFNHEKNVIMVMAPKNLMTDRFEVQIIRDIQKICRMGYCCMPYAETYEFEPFK